MSVRPARPAEAALLPPIQRSSNQAFRGTFAADEARSTAEDYLPLIEAGTLWVAVDGADRPVAFLAAGAYADGGVIHQISTLRDHQQRGHGAALMAQAIAWARREVHPRLMLTTNRDIAWNEPWYRRFGFSEPSEAERTQSLSHMLSHEADQDHDQGRRVGLVLTLG